ncbi:maternal effect protein oskar [Drosophila sulfurigaster albostrigata]|uniref:maternal effect protein oskar n=1 Tax=Drosophila sulfurigaster albostrigata TaxID=89887 RepID=UPI002D21A6A4|nr:maternal effect protein oskar [Drosophila sulfurigaster albostrigata]
MATFRSEFNSVPSTYPDRLTAIRKKLTTCFHQWHKQLQLFKQDCSTLRAKSIYWQKFKKIYNKKAAQLQQRELVKLISQEEVIVQEQQLQFVATLFSSTLISKFNSKNSTSCSNMTILDDSYIGVRDEYPDIDAEIRAILMANAQNGVTISSIKNEYRNMTGNTFPLRDNITDFLLTIPYVTAECCVSGKRIFNIKPTEDTRHLHDMVLNQRQRENGNSKNNNHISAMQEPPRLWRSQYRRRSPQNENCNYNLNTCEKPPAVKIAPEQQLATAAMTPFCIYQDNWKHLNNQYQLTQLAAQNNNNQFPCIRSDPAQLQIAPQPPEQLQHHQIGEYTHKRRHEFTPTPTTLSCPSQHDSMFTINSDCDAYLLDFPLLGDDFFLYLARMELKCRFKKYEKVLQSGLCISGQTINAARQRLQHVELHEMTQIIVNIGSVDIMRGKPLVQIEHDFRQLIKEMHNRRFVPVLTTLAPLANYCHDKQTCEKVLRFNKFIRSEGRHLTVIDIHSCLINENGVVRFDCFQNGPRSVTGSPEPYVFWNKIGRQRVLQMIEQNMEYH